MQQTIKFLQSGSNSCAAASRFAAQATGTQVHFTRILRFQTGVLRHKARVFKNAFRAVVIFTSCLIILAKGVQAQSLQGPATAPDFWQSHNSTVSLHAEQTIQNYREIDTQGLTPDGILNTENGRLSGVRLQARWQGQWGVMPLWIQASISSLSGRTAYQGYLQSGLTLTQFQAQTGNSLQQAVLRLGVPIDSGDFQWVPYAEVEQTHWQRNLLQYGETYRFTSESLGLMTQWRLAPAWVLEATLQASRQQKPNISVPVFSFAASQGEGSPVSATVGLTYRFHPKASVQFQAGTQRFSNAASPFVNGLQAPPSQTKQIRTGLALAWHFL